MDDLVVIEEIGLPTEKIGSPNIHFREINTALPNLRKEQKFADLIFVCRESETECNGSARMVFAHQAVFFPLSNMIKELFSIAHNKQPYEKIVMTLDQVDACVVEKLVEYLYHGSTTLSKEQRFQLKDLCALLQLKMTLWYSKLQIRKGSNIPCVQPSDVGNSHTDEINTANKGPQL